MPVSYPINHPFVPTRAGLPGSELPFLLHRKDNPGPLFSSYPGLYREVFDRAVLLVRGVPWRCIRTGDVQESGVARAGYTGGVYPGPAPACTPTPGYTSTLHQNTVSLHIGHRLPAHRTPSMLLGHLPAPGTPPAPGPGRVLTPAPGPGSGINSCSWTRFWTRFY